MADQAVTISRENLGEGETLRGRYVARAADSEAEAELTWYHDGEAQGEDVRVADHTFTPPQLRGRGIAKELVKALEEFENLQGFLEHVSLIMDNESEEAGAKVELK